MKIVKTPQKREYSVEAAAILEVPSEDVLVDISSESVEVHLGKLMADGFKVTGEVPGGKVTELRAWATALLESF